MFLVDDKEFVIVSTKINFVLGQKKPTILDKEGFEKFLHTIDIVEGWLGV